MVHPYRNQTIAEIGFTHDPCHLRQNHVIISNQGPIAGVCSSERPSPILGAYLLRYGRKPPQPANIGTAHGVIPTYGLPHPRERWYIVTWNVGASAECIVGCILGTVENMQQVRPLDVLLATCLHAYNAGPMQFRYIVHDNNIWIFYWCDVVGNFAAWIRQGLHFWCMRLQYQLHVHTLYMYM
jgi:hypothetical protein